MLLRQKAIKLRKDGYSYSLISESLKTSKSTLNYWLKDIPYEPNQIVLDRIKNSSTKSASVLRRNKKRRDRIARQSGKNKVGKLTRRDLSMIGIGLYIGEGTKNKTQMVRVINSDPSTILIAMNWLKQIYGLKDNNFRLSIHLYPDLNIKKTLNFWSEVTKIPLQQFRKTQIDVRPKNLNLRRRILRYGTAQLTVYSDGDKKKGVYLFHKIMGQIDTIKEQINAGIV